MSFAKILVAIDRPPLKLGVFEQALDLAQKESARLLVFHCISEEFIGEPMPPASPEIGLDPLGIGSWQPLQQELQLETMQEQVEQVQAWLQGHYQQATALGISTELDYRMGNPGSEICDTARNWGADLVILGRRGLKGLSEFFEGSVSNYVVHHAPCSVLVIQHEEGSDD